MWRLAAALVGVARKALDAISPGDVLNHIHTFIHTKTYTHVSARARTHINVNLCWSVCAHRCTQNRTHTHHSHTYTHARPTQIHQKFRAGAHTHTRAHPHLPTHKPTCCLCRFVLAVTRSVSSAPELLASPLDWWQQWRRSEIRPGAGRYWHCYQ